MRERLLEALPCSTVVARAPGRVNLLGEHTDYNGFGVLPMAIDRHVWVAVAPRPGGEVVVRSLEPERYPREIIALDALSARDPRTDWVDYVVAAVRCRPRRQGVEIVVGGDVPVAAGLSSSAALVVATLLALAPADDRLALAEEARVAEQYVGTLAGGMDQAIALLAQAGHALQIDFAPLRAIPVPLPAELAIVVANSGVPAPKGGNAQAAYNQRVRECGRAAALLGAPAGGCLGDVATERRDPDAIADPVLRKRARFVFAEADRRDAAVEALRAGDLAALGRLVDASHAGLRDDYEVSHPAVDALVDELRAAGALGARIVGAGFGGCAVAVAERAAVPELIERLRGRAEAFEAAGPAERETLTPPPSPPAT